MDLHNELPRIIVMIWVIGAITTSTSQVIKPDCQEKCGDVSIPYPFGTRDDCSLKDEFLISCNETSDDPKPILGKNIEVLNISVDDHELRVLLYIAKDCYNINGKDEELSNSPNAYSPKFPFSYTRNKFVAIGCDTYAVINGKGEEDVTTRNVQTGCLSVCDNEDSVSATDSSCSGIGCCQTSIPKGMLYYNVTINSFKSHTGILDFNPCSYSFLAEEASFKFSKAYLREFNRSHFPTVLDWAVSDKKCEAAKKEAGYLCKSSISDCYESENGPGYLCKCSQGYHGNPYLPDGCTDIDECLDPELNVCKEQYYCMNTVGSFNCQCPKGYHGKGTKDEGCADIDECLDPELNDCKEQYFCVNTEGSFNCQCPKGYHGKGTKDEGCVADQSLVIKITVGIGGSLIVLLMCSGFLYLGYKKRRLLELKQKYFRQNGGLMLQQQVTTREGYHDTAKIYTAEELEKATNKYDDSRIIGRGGYGTVYKGILAPDNRVVAIKKSKLVDQSQIEQFINEVVVLSQINHRNVVKLLGCCLETEVPLLVYEFVSNGTLYEHIHRQGNVSAMSWDTRLRVAAETAGVLSYLHSAASIPIIHRDVKSTNILLDDTYIAKVSDFGASRLVPLDQTELSTMVQGTLGYLDPEYLQTSQLTEKSDVYSFGVVLVELLTGKKPLSFDLPEAERCLANYFLASLKEDRLFQVLEDGVVKEGSPEQLIEVANLAKRCLRVKGEDRPTMKEVAMELEGLRVMGKHAWVNAEMIKLEETEHLLGNGGSGSTSIVYDSMRNHVVLTVGNGR